MKPPFSQSWNVGRFRVTLIAQPSRDPRVPDVVIVWDPAKPQRPLTMFERRDFVSGRDAAIADLERDLGVKVVVRDLGEGRRV